MMGLLSAWGYVALYAFIMALFTTVWNKQFLPEREESIIVLGLIWPLIAPLWAGSEVGARIAARSQRPRNQQ